MHNIIIFVTTKYADRNGCCLTTFRTGLSRWTYRFSVITIVHTIIHSTYNILSTSAVKPIIKTFRKNYIGTAGYCLYNGSQLNNNPRRATYYGYLRVVFTIIIGMFYSVKLLFGHYVLLFFFFLFFFFQNADNLIL